MRRVMSANMPAMSENTPAMSENTPVMSANTPVMSANMMFDSGVIPKNSQSLAFLDNNLVIPDYIQLVVVVEPMRVVVAEPMRVVVAEPMRVVGLTIFVVRIKVLVLANSLCLCWLQM